MTTIRRKLLAAVCLAALSLVSSCGNAEDDGPDETPPFVPEPIPNLRPAPVATSLNCPTGTMLDYENFGAAFMRTHCTSCHASTLPEGRRGGAPRGVDLDTPTGVALYRGEILALATGEAARMPPSGSVPESQRRMLAEWLNCGVPED